MLLVLAASIAATQPAPSPSVPTLGRTAWVFSTVGHSEWCPAGNVILDLRTGRYTLTPRASRRVCNDATFERPVEKGRLGLDQLAAVRSAYLRGQTEGLTVCRYGEQPKTVVISNGGVPILIL